MFLPFFSFFSFYIPRFVGSYPRDKSLGRMEFVSTFGYSVTELDVCMHILYVF